jgi:hypothetical protein
VFVIVIIALSSSASLSLTGTTRIRSKIMCGSVTFVWELGRGR